MSSESVPVQDSDIAPSSPIAHGDTLVYPLLPTESYRVLTCGMIRPHAPTYIKQGN